ncbi:hypothetical protein ABZ517_14920 [Streptomyces scabiei]|uniref:hypothetical protein n=1 Tax=Streptomyces scabiei TaxID=1930 RepID=UPI0033D38FF1
MNFPPEVDFAKLRAVCELLELAAEDVLELHLGMRRVTVTFCVRDGEGRKRLVGNELMTHQVHIPVRHAEGAPGAPA